MSSKCLSGDFLFVFFFFYNEYKREKGVKIEKFPSKFFSASVYFMKLATNI